VPVLLVEFKNQDE